MFVFVHFFPALNSKDRANTKKPFHAITLLYSHGICFIFLSLPLYTCSSGSHIENWHSVLRNGLVNASYTKLQVCNPGSQLDASPIGQQTCPCTKQARCPADSFSQLMDASFLFISFAIGILASRAHQEIFLASVSLFLPSLLATADSMSLPVVGQRKWAVVSAESLCALLGSTIQSTAQVRSVFKGRRGQVLWQ